MKNGKVKMLKTKSTWMQQKNKLKVQKSIRRRGIMRIKLTRKIKNSKKSKINYNETYKSRKKYTGL